MSHTLLQALCLVLVIEGILPFLCPRLWRQAMAQAVVSPDRQLRILGLISMVVGVSALYLLK